MWLFSASLIALLIYHGTKQRWDRLEFSHQILVIALMILMLYSVLSSTFKTFTIAEQLDQVLYYASFGLIGLYFLRLLLRREK